MPYNRHGAAQHFKSERERDIEMPLKKAQKKEEKKQQSL